MRGKEVGSLVRTKGIIICSSCQLAKLATFLLGTLSNDALGPYYSIVIKCIEQELLGRHDYGRFLIGNNVAFNK